MTVGLKCYKSRLMSGLQVLDSWIGLQVQLWTYLTVTSDRLYSYAFIHGVSALTDSALRSEC